MLHAARADPRALHIGIDAAPDGLKQASRQALRARPALPNLLSVHASAEALPDELDGMAERLTVILPWGSLLRAVTLPAADTLRDIRRMCRESAEFEAIVSFDPTRDAAEIDRLGLADRLETFDVRAMAPHYEAAGFRLRAIEPLSTASLRELPTTWARRLSQGDARRAWRIAATALGSLPISQATAVTRS